MPLPRIASRPQNAHRLHRRHPKPAIEATRVRTPSDPEDGHHVRCLNDGAHPACTSHGSAPDDECHSGMPTAAMTSERGSRTTGIAGSSSPAVARYMSSLNIPAATQSVQPWCASTPHWSRRDEVDQCFRTRAFRHLADIGVRQASRRDGAVRRLRINSLAQVTNWSTSSASPNLGHDALARGRAQGALGTAPSRERERERERDGRQDARCVNLAIVAFTGFCDCKLSSTRRKAA